MFNVKKNLNDIKFILRDSAVLLPQLNHSNKEYINKKYGVIDTIQYQNNPSPQEQNMLISRYIDINKRLKIFKYKYKFHDTTSTSSNSICIDIIMLDYMIKLMPVILRVVNERKRLSQLSKDIHIIIIINLFDNILSKINKIYSIYNKPLLNNYNDIKHDIDSNMNKDNFMKKYIEDIINIKVSECISQPISINYNDGIGGIGGKKYDYIYNYDNDNNGNLIQLQLRLPLTVEMDILIDLIDRTINEGGVDGIHLRTLNISKEIFYEGDIIQNLQRAIEDSHEQYQNDSSRSVHVATAQYIIHKIKSIQSRISQLYGYKFSYNEELTNLPTFIKQYKHNIDSLSPLGQLIKKQQLNDMYVFKIGNTTYYDNDSSRSVLGLEDENAEVVVEEGNVALENALEYEEDDEEGNSPESPLLNSRSRINFNYGTRGRTKYLKYKKKYLLLKNKLEL